MTIYNKTYIHELTNQLKIYYTGYHFNFLMFFSHKSSLLKAILFKTDSTLNEVT